MLSKLNLPIAIALALAASAGIARAAPRPTDADRSAAESGIPDSIQNRDRMFGRHSPSNDEINAAEIGNPESVDNRRQMRLSTGGGWQEAWQALEFGNPDFR
ncbi:MAG TPA: hypothetical protein VEP66_22545 [Myxococcales bacterium]|nr:hypothetical protein [Myxococcales bacterium]